MNRQRIGALIEAADRPLIGLAVVAVALYLADLAGLFADPATWRVYAAISLCFDIVFFADLVVKLVVLRGPYIKSAWFIVDLVAALPLLSALTLLPNAMHGLRFVRTFRILRALRLLRVMRNLRILRVADAHQGDTPEFIAYQRALRALVVAYSAIFLGLVLAVRAGTPPGRVLTVEGIDADSPVQVSVMHDDGTVEVLSMLPRQIYANGDLIELYLVLGSLLGMFLVLAVTHYQIPALWSRQLRTLLGIALPEQVARHLFDNPDAYDQSVRAPATVLFCDIKGFTSTVEHLALDEVKLHLEAALDAVVEAHRAHDLIIDKFIGDAVMSFRGGNIAGGTPADIAYRVVRAALDGEAALRKLGDPWFRAIKMGGASGDDVLIGAFGTSKRLSYTVLGDRVNLAARLEASCAAVGVGNLFCDQTQALTSDRVDIVWRRVGALTVQGKTEVIPVYQAFDKEDAPSWLGQWRDALEHFEARRFSEASAAIVEVVRVAPDDGPATRISALSAAYLVEPPPADWTAVLETKK